jgi:hypothetical protein
VRSHNANGRNAKFSTGKTLLIFYAAEVFCFKSKTLPYVPILAHNIVHRFCAEACKRVKTMLVRNFYAWQESSFKSMTLTWIKCLAHNLINRICGEVDIPVKPRQAPLRSSLRTFCA